MGECVSLRVICPKYHVSTVVVSCHLGGQAPYEFNAKGTLLLGSEVHFTIAGIRFVPLAER